MMVFNTFNIIPEYCFECYKVTITPRTVMELFKVFLVLANLKLPNNNERKCMVEIRPELAKGYKGFVYCDSLEEAKEIMGIVQLAVNKAIPGEIPIQVKRGCSEFSSAYPGYGRITGDKMKQLNYKEEWRKHEDYVDTNLAKATDKNPNNFTFDHQGLTLLDAMVMRKWLAYAAVNGDLTYRDINPPSLPRSYSYC